MAKRFKLRLSKVIQSFRFCRSKNPNRLSISLVPPSIHRLSPFNQKSFDISYPRCPNPPSSTPITSYAKRLVPAGCGRCSAREAPSECSVESSPEWVWRKKVDGGGESDDGDESSTSPLVAKKRAGKRKGAGRGASSSIAARSRMSSSSGGCDRSSSDASNERDDSKSLITNNTTTSDKKNRAPKSLKRQAWNSRSSKSKLKTTTTRVMQSVAVEKTSEDPYGDFKRSMMEMIVEKQIFEVRDLEELLQCFLTLNSRNHHKVIIEAFTEIWEALFAEFRIVAEKGV
uniref:Transcription repressor n=1 Tax=Kalanchoe fedtschenkoi TaxID=63787 RepID=A0A7N0TY00_KALFE